MNKVVEFKEKDYLRNKIDKKKYSLQFLPSSLEELSKIKKVSYGGVKLKTSYIIDIVHNLLLKYYFKKDNSFNLSATILKEKYGHIYNYYMDYLVKNEIIILVRKHQKGKNSRIYKLNEKIIKGEIKRYKNQDNVLLKKYRNAISIVETDSSYGSLILSEVKKKLVEDLFHVGIDLFTAISFLDFTNKDTDIYNRNKYSVECIHDNHIFYHFDDFGRLHTNFTILKSFIRKNCLLIDGEKTCEIDIPNSQPLFLTKLIEENDTFIVDENEFDLLKVLTKNGTFYDYIIQNFPIYNNKKMAKEMVYKVLFGKNYLNNDVRNFTKIFPTIYKFIKSYKREMGNYKLLSHHLQRIESNFIFNKLIKTIMLLYPEIKIVTVHDSIIIPIRYKEIVDTIFNQKMEAEFYFF